MKKRADIEVVILAAGEAKRFGSPKQLADWFGLPLLKHSLDVCAEAGLKVNIALGAHKDLILKDPLLELSHCKLLSIPHWEKGLSASIKESVIQCRRQSALTGILFILADQPLVTVLDINRLMTQVRRNPESIVCARYPKTRPIIRPQARAATDQKEADAFNVGVPAYFPRCYFDALCQLEGDLGAKSVIQSKPFISVEFEYEMIDIDSPEDLIRAQALYSKTSSL